MELIFETVVFSIIAGFVSTLVGGTTRRRVEVFLTTLFTCILLLILWGMYQEITRIKMGGY